MPSPVEIDILSIASSVALSKSMLGCEVSLAVSPFGRVWIVASTECELESAREWLQISKIQNIQDSFLIYRIFKTY